MFIFVLYCYGKTMIQTLNLFEIALCDGVKPPVVRQSLLAVTAPSIGFFDTVNPVLIYRVQNKNRGNQQATLTLVSAGNDLRVSTMRPDPKSANLNSEGEIQGLSSVDFSDN